ncbi:SRPBCC family protein [Gordonia sp. MP11Mi]|uniref:Uncharacterized protein n=1 Tax=Gordonia sp. MP11Mi TaxID=3022769 RepID=A0AA97CUZ7_9ACTN
MNSSASNGSHGATAVTQGARFVGHNQNQELGQWHTTSVITDVEDGRRWVWSVGLDDGEPWAYWAFEVDPARDGCIVRQWVKIGNGQSPFAGFVAAAPGREARIIDGRLRVWRAGMESNLDAIERVSACGDVSR